MTDESPLEKQIAAEAAEIDNAPKIKIETGRVGRCSFCGRIAQHLLECHDYSPGAGQIVHERYKGECCRPQGV